MAIIISGVNDAIEWASTIYIGDRDCNGRDIGMKRTLIYDISRLFLGPLSLTPRGIDRVDLLLARYFLTDPSTNFLAVVPTLLGMQVLDAARVGRGLHQLEVLWSETSSPEGDPQFRRLLDLLAGAEVFKDKVLSAKLSLPEKLARMASLHAAVGFAPGKSVARHVPSGAIYLSVGHYGPAFPFLMHWLGRRRDVRPVLMLHDVIPLETPEYVSPQLTRLHARMVRSVARYGAGLIVSSDHARTTVRSALAAVGRCEIPDLVARLPLAEAFDDPVEALPALRNSRYFVVCGTLEPRKNHQLVLEIWRRLNMESPNPPHLVFVGAPGWQSGLILHMLKHSGPMLDHVHHISGLSTPALKSLLVGACALLSPTFSEGFGLPIIEAEHLGVPVIASDIPAHREVASANTLLLDPTDGPAWREAINVLSTSGSGGQRPRPAKTAVLEREAYISSICAFLDQIGATHGH